MSTLEEVADGKRVSDDTDARTTSLRIFNTIKK